MSLTISILNKRKCVLTLVRPGPGSCPWVLPSAWASGRPLTGPSQSHPWALGAAVTCGRGAGPSEAGTPCLSQPTSRRPASASPSTPPLPLCRHVGRILCWGSVLCIANGPLDARSTPTLGGPVMTTHVSRWPLGTELALAQSRRPAQRALVPELGRSR